MLTDTDRALLGRPLHGLLTTAPAGERLPAPRPVWFELTDDERVQLFSFTGAVKVRRLRARPHASLVVVRPADEPDEWVSLEGDVSLHDDGAFDLATRLMERYRDVSQPEHRDMLESWAHEDLVRIVLHPTRVARGPS